MAFYAAYALALALLVAMATRQQGQTVPFAHPAPPLVGNWELNVGRTHYGPGVDRRRRERMACTPEAEKVRCVIRSTRTDGRELTGQFTASLDGVAAPVAGIPDVDEVQLWRPNVSLIDAIFFLRGKPVVGYRAFQSDDGRSLMILSVDPVTRAASTTVVVYDRR
jgi:hypothetical protein